MKRGRKILLILIIIAIALIAYRIYSSPESGKKFGISTIADICNSGGTGSSSVIFDCPADSSVDKCEVYGFKNCNEKVGTQTVTLRTNFNGYPVSGSWLSINCIPSGASCITTSNLNGYCYTSTASNNPLGTNVATTNSGIRIYAYNSRIYIEKSSTATQIFAPCSTADISLSPTEPYKSNNQEKYSGTSMYYCESNAYLTSNGVENLVEKAIYSNPTTSGTYNTKTYLLDKGQRFRFDGGTINWQIIKPGSVSCIVDKCNNARTGILVCSTDQYGCPKIAETAVLCPNGMYCIDLAGGAKCKSPFEISIALEDIDGNKKTSFGVGEDIYVRILVDSLTEKSATIKSLLLNSQDNQISPEQSKGVSFPNTQSWRINYDGIKEVGEYKILVKIPYGDAIINQEISFRVSNPIYMAVRAFSEGAGTALYTNNPVIIELRVFDGTADQTTPTSANTNVNLLLSTTSGKILNLVAPTVQQYSLGIYRYTITPGEEGLLKVIGSAEKFGYIVNHSEEFIVLPSDIQIKFSNIDLLANINLGIHEVKFETRDPQGNLINSQNTVQVLSKDGKVTDVTSISGSNGQYSFNYNFATQGGYWFKVRSTASGYTPKTTDSPSINVRPGPNPVCASKADCPTGYTCTDGKCVAENPINIWLWVILIGGSITMVIIIVLLVIKLKKRRVAY